MRILRARRSVGDLEGWSRIPRNAPQSDRNPSAASGLVYKRHRNHRKGGIMHKTAVIAVFVSASLAYAAIAQAQGSAGDAGTSKPKASQGKAGVAKEEKASAAKEVKTASGLIYTELKAGTGP